MRKGRENKEGLTRPSGRGQERCCQQHHVCFSHSAGVEAQRRVKGTPDEGQCCVQGGGDSVEQSSVTSLLCASRWDAFAENPLQAGKC